MVFSKWTSQLGDRGSGVEEGQVHHATKGGVDQTAFVRDAEVVDSHATGAWEHAEALGVGEAAGASKPLPT